MRKKLVAGNWKMNLTGPEGAALVEGFSKHVEFRANVDVVVCPTYLALAKVHDAVKGSQVALGAQDVFWLDKGAFTGNISAPMLTQMGVTYCIVGHSETRGRFGKLEVPESTLPYFGETEETINLKIRALLNHAITPILCVGETLAEREAGNTDSIIAEQLKGALAGIEPEELSTLVVAYEPVWAIGTGKTCDSPEAERVCAAVRSCLKGLLGESIAEGTRILYGGSVKSSNSDELFKQPNIDGGLVGGASMDAQEFCRIIMSA